MKLIDADALIESLAVDQNECPGCPEPEWIDELIRVLNAAPTVDAILPAGTYQCFHCGSQSVIWDNDHMFDELGYDGYGMVHLCHCMNCGAEIEYRIELEGDPDDDASSSGERGNQ